MKQYYNNTIIHLSTQSADRLVLKPICGAKIIIDTIENDKFVIDTTDWNADTYYIQYVKENEIIKTDKITLNQNLLFVDDDYDPRSQYQIVIEAIDAMLQNRATAQQKKIQVGDKSIEYSTLQQLLQWRKYMVEQMRKQQGKTTNINREVGVFKRY